jgi:hypothetical protein
MSSYAHAIIITVHQLYGKKLYDFERDKKFAPKKLEIIVLQRFIELAVEISPRFGLQGAYIEN